MTKLLTKKNQFYTSQNALELTYSDVESQKFSRK